MLSLDALIQQGMGPSLHWFPESAGPARLAEVMVGMANARGGTILIGISPRSGSVQGVTDPEKSADKIFQAALLSDPPLILPLPTTETIQKEPVLQVSIPNGLPNVYSLNGKYLMREGRHTKVLAARKLRRLMVERGVLQFERQVPPGASIGDLDQTAVNAYLDHIAFQGDTSSDSFLFRRGCLQLEGDKYLPSYAGLLLFGRHPQQWLPNATVLAARFTGGAFADEYLKQDISGTLPHQLRNAVQFAQTNVNHVVRVEGLTHKESPEYPLEAVRELIVNAVAHRDYNVGGDTIHLHLFADRMEILSPGGLPGPVNLDNLLISRFSRNPVIVQVLADMGFVERLGYGLDRVMTVMDQFGLAPPAFEDAHGRFRVTLLGFSTAEKTPVSNLAPYLEMDLNPRQTLLLDYLGGHPRITNRTYRDLCPEVHPETLRRDLSDLVKRNVLLKIGAKKGTYYILKG